MNSFKEGNNLGEVIFMNLTKYWHPDTGKYDIWRSKSSVRLWSDVNYNNLMDGSIHDIGRLIILLQSIDKNNFICIENKHTHHLVPVNSTQQIMKMLDISNRGTFKKFWDKIIAKDIVAVTSINDSINTKKKYTRFIVNPCVAMSDRGITPSTYKLFHKSIAPLIPYSAKKNLSILLAEQEGRFDNNMAESLQVVSDISALTISNAPDIKNTITDCNIARDIARGINMAEWLKIENPIKFPCILPGHNVNDNTFATIYQNDGHDRYFCICCNEGRGVDSIDFVRFISGCSYQEALKYLCRIQGFNYEEKTIQELPSKNNTF